MKVVQKSEYLYSVFVDGFTVFSNGLILNGKQLINPLTGLEIKSLKESRGRIIEYKEDDNQSILMIGILIYHNNNNDISFEKLFDKKIIYNRKTNKFSSENFDKNDNNTIFKQISHYYNCLDEKSNNELRIFLFSLISNECWYDKILPIISLLNADKENKDAYLINILDIYLNDGKNILEQLSENGFSVTIKTLLLDTKLLAIYKDLKLTKYSLNFCKMIEKEACISLLFFASETIKKYNKNNAKLIFDFLYSILKLYKFKADKNFLNDLREVMDSVYEYNVDVIGTLNYAVKELFKEGWIDARLNCIISLFQTYRDYLKMNKEIGIDFKLYPDDLEIEHKLLAKLYNTVMEERKIEREKHLTETMTKEEAMKTIGFEDSVIKCKKLEYSDAEYSVIIPESINEIINEGRNLNHCVASYVDDVVKGYTNILFLRKKSDINKPFMTLEVKHNCLYQAKKRSDKYPDKEEEVFLKKWAYNKNLEIRGY